MITGGILLLTIVGALVYKENPAEAQSVENGGSVDNGDALSLVESLKQHVCRVPVLTYYGHRFFWNGGYVLLRVFLYNYIVTQYASPFWAGIALTLFGAGQLFMSFVMAAINGKFSTNKYLVQLSSLVLMTLSACVMGLVENLYVTLALSCFYGGMFGVLFTNIRNIERHINGNRSHTLVYALSQMSGGIGALVTPPVIALIGVGDSLELKTLFYFSAGMTATSFSFLFILLLRNRHLWRPLDARIKDTVNTTKESHIAESSE